MYHLNSFYSQKCMKRVLFVFLFFLLCFVFSEREGKLNHKEASRIRSCAAMQPEITLQSHTQAVWPHRTWDIITL